MTLGAIWVRRNSTLHELVVITDSRLSGGGERWDAVPKIIQLPRPGTFVAMSGDAGTAYAFLLQAMNTCALLDGHGTGRTDVRTFATDLEDLFKHSRNHLRVDIRGLSHPTVDIVLGGWSWRRLRFEGYSYRYDDDGSLHMHRLSELDYGRRMARTSSVTTRQPRTCVYGN